MRLISILALVLFTTFSGGRIQAADRFEKTAIILEQTVQDADAEVKFHVISGSGGLSSLQVTAPDGRIVLDLKSPSSKLGLRHLTLETPEPKNDGRLQADFPQGIYTFTSITTAGKTLHGEAKLTHDFPPATIILSPRADAGGVPVAGLRITWAAVKDIPTISLLIEDEKTGREFSAILPGHATSLTVPPGFLTGGTKYKLAVGTIANSGNKTISEIDLGKY